MLSLPLTSLSTAQDADPSLQRFDWHKDSQGLTFVIDSYGAGDSSQLVKVVQGTQVRVRRMHGKCLTTPEPFTRHQRCIC